MQKNTWWDSGLIYFFMCWTVQKKKKKRKKALPALIYIMILNVCSYFLRCVLCWWRGIESSHNGCHLKITAAIMLCFISVGKPFGVFLHASVSTSARGSASCHVGSCIWTWVSSNLSRPSPRSFSAPAKTGCMAQSHRRPLHLPSSPVPKPLCPGSCGGGCVFFRSGKGARERLQGWQKGMWRGWCRAGGWRFCLAWIRLSGLYQTSAIGENSSQGFEVFWGPTDSEGVTEPDRLQVKNMTINKTDAAKEKFFFPWQQWHADRRSPASEAPVAARVWLWSPVEHPGLFTKTLFPGCRAQMCVRRSVCCVWVCAWECLVSVWRDPLLRPHSLDCFLRFAYELNKCWRHTTLQTADMLTLYIPLRRTFARLLRISLQF